MLSELKPKEPILKDLRKHGLSTEQFLVSAFVGSSKNLKDLEDPFLRSERKQGFYADSFYGRAVSAYAKRNPNLNDLNGGLFRILMDLKDGPITSGSHAPVQVLSQEQKVVILVKFGPRM